MANWYSCPSAGHEIHGQSLVIDEATGANIAVIYGDSPGDAHIIAAAPAMLAALNRGASEMLALAETARGMGLHTIADNADKLGAAFVDAMPIGGEG